MTSLSEPVAAPAPRRAGHFVTAALVVAALAWIVILRVPLVLNAGVHLDSDLAVDGLTLLDVLHGQWRWHFPGTPHMGILPVLLSLPQAAFLGATPETLVSGGLVAYMLVVLATFALAWQIGGRSMALWSLVPLTFASTGLLWLSGRITGGHLLTAAWHAAAFALLARLLTRGGFGLAAALGVWCGLGLYLDRLFLFSLLGIVPAVLVRVVEPGNWRRRAAETLLVGLSFIFGYVPQPLGNHFDPHDAYGSQFDTILVDPSTRRIDWDITRTLALDHTYILTLECLPRLFTGHRVVWNREGPAGLASDPSRALFGGRPERRDRVDNSPIALAAFSLGLACALLALLGLYGSTPAAALVCGGLFASALLSIAGFLLNRNIYNSDNYRYLVTMVVPWAIGLGGFFQRLARRGGAARFAAFGLAALLAIVMTLDTVAWYERLGWLDGLTPVRATLDDPALVWLEDHPEIDAIFGGYWDVYRLSFLRGGSIRGIPYPDYPDRFPDWTRTFPGNRPRTLIARPDARGPFYRDLALQQEGRMLANPTGTWIIDWPNDR